MAFKNVSASVGGTGLTIQVRQSNRKNSPKRGEWYGRAKHNGIIEESGLIDHVSKDSHIERAIVVAATEALVKQIHELCRLGYKVRLDELGTFYLAVSSKSAATVKQYDCSKCITGYRMGFLPTSMMKSEMAKTKLQKSTIAIDMNGKHVNSATGEPFGKEDEEENEGE